MEKQNDNLNQNKIINMIFTYNNDDDDDDGNDDDDDD